MHGLIVPESDCGHLNINVYHLYYNLALTHYDTILNFCTTFFYSLVFTPRVLNIQELRRNKLPEHQVESQAKAASQLEGQVKASSQLEGQAKAANQLEGQAKAASQVESKAKAASQLDVYANKSLVIQNKKVPYRYIHKKKLFSWTFSVPKAHLQSRRCRQQCCY